jgi:hypothetical protein
MIIKNSTNWDTSDLRRLFHKCVQEVEKVEKPNYRFKDRRRRFTLEIMNTEGGSRGRATTGGHWVMIKIPRDWAEPEMSFDHKINLARLMIHEYYHTIGFSYHDKRNYKNDFTAKWEVDWVKNYPIKPKQIIIKPKQDIKTKRYQQAIKNLALATTRKKRSETIYKKWRDKCSYYRRQLKIDDCE